MDIHMSNLMAILFYSIIALEEAATQEIKFYNWDGQEIVPIVQ